MFDNFDIVKMMKEYFNIPEHSELRRLGTQHFGDDFTERFDREVPIVSLHFNAQTPRQLRESGHIEELLTLLRIMTKEESHHKLQQISHKLKI